MTDDQVSDAHSDAKIASQRVTVLAVLAAMAAASTSGNAEMLAASAAAYTALTNADVAVVMAARMAPGAAN